MGACGQRRLDHSVHTIDVLKHIIIPETQDTEAQFGEAGVSRPILRGIGMLAAIDLDDQRSVEASEVNNKVVDRALPSETMTIDLPLPQISP